VLKRFVEFFRDRESIDQIDAEDPHSATLRGTYVTTRPPGSPE
jgi:hypothetical protein